MINPYFDQTIGVLCGGFSKEREVSLRSGQAVYEALVRCGYHAIKIDPVLTELSTVSCDIFFNVLHGQFGEDGSVQAYLEHLGKPYTGSGVASSVMTMNKYLTKLALIGAGIPTPRFAVATPTHVPDVSHLGFPLILKPINEGSSLGVEIVDNEVDYRQALSKTLAQFGQCLIEEFIAGAEISVGVLDQDGVLGALPILELRPKNRFYDYEAKYTDGKTDFIIPSQIGDAFTKQAHEYAVKAHQITGCCGLSRSDMMVDPVKGPFVLEVNSVPGMTTLSDLPAQARAAGISFDELVKIILKSASHHGA